jgi:class 3 adenylate cyclase/predicted ATPase
MRCSSCGTENPASTKFCSECGSPLRPAAPAAPAERRHLTVAFVDLVGSTALSQSLDPEDLRELIKEYQAACRAAVDRYDGYIGQYLGDGILAYFGFPVAHEDDAVRAVLAGLEIVDQVNSIAMDGHRVRVRIGIHTGLVVVGEVGGGERREQVAFGETPNIAARIQGEADPGTVVISEATRRLVAGHFTFDDRGEHELKGIAQPVQLYRVLGRSGAKRFDALATSGLAPFVGREDELAAIRAAWDESKEGAGQMIVLRGEPGIGKSRLLGAAREVARGEGWEVLDAECSPHNVNSALFPVIEMLKGRLGFDGHDDGTRVKLLEAFTAARGVQAEDAVPLLASLLAIPVNGNYEPVTRPAQEVRDRTLDVLSDLLLGVGESRPCLLALEDLHWADPSTLELLAALVERQAAAQLLTICTTRPELSIPWPLAPQWRELSIESLPPANVRALIAGVVGEKPLPDEVVEQIATRTSGVPLFVEAVTRSIMESGVLDELDDRFELNVPLPPGLIPATVQDSLMARIDRLGPAKPIAQLAATIGREFGFDLLQTVGGQSAESLAAALQGMLELGLVSQSGEPPESVYHFKHALIRDAAYESLLRRTRQEFHQRIGSALLEHFPSTAEQRPELVAEHFTAAALVEEAIPYWLAAGELAAARGAYHESVAHFRRGLALLLELPDAAERAEQELEFQNGLARALTPIEGWGSSELGAIYERLSELLADSPYRVLTLGGMLSYHILGGRSAAAFPLAYESLEVATVAGDPSLIAYAQANCCCVNWFADSPSRAIEHGEASLALMNPETEQGLLAAINLSVSVSVGGYMTTALWMVGYPDQARAMRDRTVELARELKHPPSLALALYFRLFLDHLLGDVVSLVEFADEAATLSRAEGFAIWEPPCNILKGWALARQGRLEEGIALARDALGTNRAAGTASLESYLSSTLAESLSSAGQHDEALALLADAISRVQTSGEHHHEPEFHRLRGEVLSEQAKSAGNSALLADAERSIRKALALARHQEARSLELRAAMSLYRLRLEQGDATAERLLLAGVYEWFTEGFDTPDLSAARTLLAGLEPAAGTPAHADGAGGGSV